MLHFGNLKIDPRDVKNIDVHRLLDLVCGRISEFSDFPRISGLGQKNALPQNLLEKLWEVFKNNCLAAM